RPPFARWSIREIKVGLRRGSVSCFRTRKHGAQSGSPCLPLFAESTTKPQAEESAWRSSTWNRSHSLQQHRRTTLRNPPRPVPDLHPFVRQLLRKLRRESDFQPF